MNSNDEIDSELSKAMFNLADEVNNVYSESEERAARSSELEAENARLRELACWQGDDAEPVTVEWLESHYPFVDDGFIILRNEKRDVPEENRNIITIREAGCLGWCLCFHGKWAAALHCRGQLRRLIAALEGK